MLAYSAHHQLRPPFCPKPIIPQIGIGRLCNKRSQATEVRVSLFCV